jgi:hypothetical protein
MPVPTPPSLSLTLPIPRPWNLEQFRLALQACRGRALLLESAPLPQGCAALRVTTDAADLIIYDQAIDSRLQLHAIGHQLAHLNLGHQGQDDRRSLFQHLDPALTADGIRRRKLSPAFRRAPIPMLFIRPASRHGKLAVICASQAKRPLCWSLIEPTRHRRMRDAVQSRLGHAQTIR